MNKRIKRLIPVLAIGAAALAGGSTIGEFLTGLGLSKKEYYADLKELCKVSEPSCALIKWIHPRLKVPTGCWAYQDKKEATYDSFCRYGMYYGPGAGGVDLDGDIIPCPKPDKAHKKIPVPCNGNTLLYGDRFENMIKHDDKKLGLELLRELAVQELGRELAQQDDIGG
jgi:hypothetical protein